MEREEKKLLNILLRNKRLLTVMVSTYLWGLLAHGTAFFQKLSVLDDVFCLFDTGATYTSGRWFLGLLTDVTAWLYGSSHYSTPLLHGVTTLGCLGLAVYLVTELLALRRWESWVLLSGLFVAFPVVASTFGYMFTAPFYGVAYLMTVAGVWVLCRRKRSFFLGVGLIACACGIYQAYLPTAICLLLLYYLRAVVDGTEQAPVKLALRMLLACAVSVAVYYGISRLTLALRGETLDSYNGIANMGQEGLPFYFSRAKLALLLFFLPGKGDPGACMYPQTLGWLYPLVLLLDAVFSVGLVQRTWRRDRAAAMWLLPALAVFPFAVNFIYIMCPTVHSLMVYAQIMPLVLLCGLAEWCFAGVTSRWGLRWLKQGALVLLALCAVLYVRLDNVTYLRTEIYQQRMISYYTTLVTQIKSMPGYQADTPVALVNSKGLDDRTFRDLDGFSEVPPYLPLAGQQSASAYPETFLEVWCGFAPPWTDAQALEALPEVQAMPHYPEDGAISWVDGVIVVKF